MQSGMKSILIVIAVFMVVSVSMRDGRAFAVDLKSEDNLVDESRAAVDREIKAEENSSPSVVSAGKTAKKETAKTPEPVIVEKPVVVEKSTVAETPAVVEKPAVAETSEVVEKPAVDETPAVEAGPKSEIQADAPQEKQPETTITAKPNSSRK